jgi:hypothetical protein
MTAFVLVVAILSIVVLAFIVYAPWKAVRDEPKLDKTVETQLLLHRNPDEPTGEHPRAEPGSDPGDGTDDGADGETGPAASYDDLTDLDADDEAEPGEPGE